MKHVPKRQRMGCAVATAAMLANRSYEELAAHWPNLDEARMRSPGELRALLEAMNDAEWYLSPCWHPQPRVREFVPPAWAVAAWIQDDAFHPRFGQWIVIEGEVAYDPGEWTEHYTDSYSRRDWVVTLVAQPVPPEEFARVRDRQPSPGRVAGAAEQGK